MIKFSSYRNISRNSYELLFLFFPLAIIAVYTRLRFFLKIFVAYFLICITFFPIRFSSCNVYPSLEEQTMQISRFRFSEIEAVQASKRYL